LGHLKDAPILCKTCGREISRSQELQENINMRFKLAQLKSDDHGNNVSYQCDSCQDIESNEPSGTGYVCSLCGCGCGNLKELEDHMVIHNDNVDTEEAAYYIIQSHGKCSIVDESGLCTDEKKT
jgi:hypothetical protein